MLSSTFRGALVSGVAVQWFTFTMSMLSIGGLGFSWLRSRAIHESGHDAQVWSRVWWAAPVAAAFWASLGRMIAPFIDVWFAAARNGGQFVAGVLGAGAPMMWRVAALALAPAGFLVVSKTSPRSAWRRTGWFLAVAGTTAPIWLAVTGALTGGEWRRVIDPLHLCAAGLWAGTLFNLFLSVGRGWRARSANGERAITAQVIRHEVHRFAPMALSSFAVLVVTGFLMGLRRIHEPVDLWTTTYGSTLVMKLGLVGAMAVTGAFNWKIVTPRLDGDDGAELLLIRSASVELLFATFVVVLSAILRALPRT